MEKPELIKAMQMPTVRMHQYERYLPTAFDESLSILEKINKVINALYELSEITKEMLDRWNEVIEWVLNDGLEQAVTDKLEEWLKDGTLEDLIDKILFGKINDKIKEIEDLIDQLKIRINELIEEMESKIDEIIGLKLDMNPVYHVTMESFQQAVTQSFIVKDDSTIYNIQATVTNPPDSERHATVNRLNRAGLLIDYMEVLHSGHGADWNLINDSGIDYLVFQDGQRRFAKIRYESNTRIDINTSQKVQFLPKYSSDSQLLAFDTDNDLMAIATLGSMDSGNNVTRGDIKTYKYSEFVAGKNNPIDSFNIENDVFQGFDIKGSRLFVYYSALQNSNMSTARLVEWNTKTGDKKTYRLGDLGQDPANNEIQKVEGEGVFIWEHPTTHEISIFICMATGFAGGSKRVRKLYGWHGMGNWQHFSNIFNEKVQGIKRTDGDSYSLTNEMYPTSLKEFTTYGEYYLRGNEIAGFNDLPEKVSLGGSGFWVVNHSKSKGGSFYQELKRNTSTNRLYRFERVVHSRSNTATEWTFYNESDSPDVPFKKVSKLSDLVQTGEYYFNTTEWKSLSDVPTSPNMGFGTSGFWVTISKRNGNRDVMQRCERNTSNTSPIIMQRAVQVAGDSVQPWAIMQTLTVDQYLDNE